MQVYPSEQYNIYFQPTPPPIQIQNQLIQCPTSKVFSTQVNQFQVSELKCTYFCMLHGLVKCFSLQIRLTVCNRFKFRPIFYINTPYVALKCIKNQTEKPFLEVYCNQTSQKSWMKLKLYTKQRSFDAEIFDASNFNARVLTARLLPLDGV